jgi:mono/diheme cytochrome c family protein
MAYQLLIFLETQEAQVICHDRTKEYRMCRIGISLSRVMTLLGLTFVSVAIIGAAKKPAIGLSGHHIFMDRCGACHGEDGKGNGPAVGALKVAPADLTLLARKNGGTFPAEYVRKMISEWVDIGAHGSREMPIWGTLFNPRSAADQQIANDQFKNLVVYLESIQQ